MAIDVKDYSDARKCVSDLLEIIVDAYEDFDYYKDTIYRNLARPAVFWPDGKSLGYGYVSHMAGTAQKFFAKFKYWGFDDLEDFYCLPIEKRNEFLKNGRTIWEAIFREDRFKEKTLEDILNIHRLDNQKQEETLSSLTKAEEAFHKKLVKEAKRIKNECYGSRRLGWRIRNEKARFKAEDKLRERSLHRSYIVEEILLSWFNLQERLKRSVDIRERFPSRVR